MAAASEAYAGLVRATRHGDIDGVRAALGAGAQPDWMNGDSGPDYELTWGVRPLYAAASQGHCEIISILIEAGASVHGLRENDETGYTALHIAANCSQFNALKVLVDAGVDVNRGLTGDVSASGLYVRGVTALDMLIHKDGHLQHEQTFLSPIRMLAQAGAMPSPGFDWEYHMSTISHDLPAVEYKKAVNERWRAFFDKLARAGGFDAYARDERRKLVVIADKFLGLDLAPQVIPIIVDFWGHPGDPWFSFSDLPPRPPRRGDFFPPRPPRRSDSSEEDSDSPGE